MSWLIKAGSLDYAKAFGYRSIADASPMRLDTSMRIMSCTKLITATCALQCVERGLIGLDDDVSVYVPKLRDLWVLVDGKVQPMTGVLTLRVLMSHSSGFVYRQIHPDLMKWYTDQPEPSHVSLEGRYSQPLVFEPGESWAYGPGMDWVGRIVETVSGLTLDEYVQKNVCKPLGISDMTFFLDSRPDMAEKRAQVYERDDQTGKMMPSTVPEYEGMKDAMGGEAISTSGEEYIKVLHSLLKDDGKLLKSETVELMFNPQLTGKSEQTLMQALTIPFLNDAMTGGLPLGVKCNYGVAGLLVQQDLNGEKWKRNGTLNWTGLFNLTWVSPSHSLPNSYA